MEPSNNNDKNALQELCQRQYKEIIRLLELNKKLEDEVDHLKNLLVSNDSLVISSSQNISNEELICLHQIQQLKKTSELGEMTYEEVKKLEILVKTLNVIRNKASSDDSSTKGLPTEELLKVVENVQS